MLRSRAVSSGSPHPTLVLLLVLSVAMGACSPRMLDSDQLERRLSRELSDQLDVPGIEVECPDAEAREGSTLDCIARAPGETAGLRIVVTQVDDDGNVTWEIAGAAG
jgi:Domain of unknown function (DUF4333)